MNLSIGVINREDAPAQHTPRTVTGAEAFAAAVAQRYMVSFATALRAELAFAWQPPGEINYFHDSPRINISPTLIIQEWQKFAGVSKVLARTQETADGYGEAEASALFRRLFSRQMRVAAFVSPRGPETAVAINSDPAFAGPLDNLRRAAVVERALPRPAATDDFSAPTEGAPLVQPSAREMEWASRPMFPSEPKPITLPAPEIRRVTEQVMREIDHRIVARRERLGKR